MKRLLAWVFRWPLVWTEDFDGEVRLRRIKKTPFGKWMGTGIISRIYLNADGTTSGARYVRHWKPANDLALNLFEPTPSDPK